MTECLVIFSKHIVSIYFSSIIFILSFFEKLWYVLP